MSLPLLNKCCFCIPLRVGLLIWAYAKLIMPFIITFSLMMAPIQTASSDLSQDSIVTVLVTLSTATPELIDLGFSIVLIVAAHKNNIKIMKLYYYYCLTMLGIYTVLTLLLALNREKFQLLHFMIFYYPFVINAGHPTTLLISFVMILVQAYLMLLVRTQILRLSEVCFNEDVPRQKSTASFKVIESPPPAKPATEVVNVTTDI